MAEEALLSLQLGLCKPQILPGGGADFGGLGGGAESHEPRALLEAPCNLERRGSRGGSGLAFIFFQLY